MKSALIAALAVLTASSAIACPRIEGQYHCQGNSKDFDGRVEIRQSARTRDGVTRYMLPYTGNVAVDREHVRIADGKAHRRHEDSRLGHVLVATTTSCSGHTVIDSAVVEGFNLQKTSRYTLGEGGKLTIEESVNGARASRAVCQSATR